MGCHVNHALCDTPILENRFMGCHGNHALSHSPHKLFLRTMFSHLGSPIEQFGTMNNLAPMRNCSG